MYGVLILSNGRADRVKTVKTLARQGFTGEWRIVIDDEDRAGEDYRRRYGDRVVEFCKQDYMEQTQTLAPKSDTPRSVVVYARNAAPDIARGLGWDYFIELDDDYDFFEQRYHEGGKLRTVMVDDLDELFSAMVRFVEGSGADALALAQGGDFIGGVDSSGATNRFLRKIMNVYCFPSDTDIRFVGCLNEDLTTSVLYGSRGALLLTCTVAGIHQTATQKAGGVDW